MPKAAEELSAADKKLVNPLDAKVEALIQLGREERKRLTNINATVKKLTKELAQLKKELPASKIDHRNDNNNNDDSNDSDNEPKFRPLVSE